MNETHGGLCCTDGSHKRGVLPATVDPEMSYERVTHDDQFDESTAASACVGKSGVVLHHVCTLHH